MALDKFSGSGMMLTAPPERGFVITPSDTAGVELFSVTRAIYVGGLGNLRVAMMGGEELIFVGVPAGTLLPVRAAKVFATSTTATFLIGLY